MKKYAVKLIKRIAVAALAAVVLIFGVITLAACNDRSLTKHDFVSLRTLRGSYIHLHIKDNMGSLALPSRPRHSVGFARNEDTVDELISAMEKVKDEGMSFEKIDDNRISVKFDKGGVKKGALIVRYDKDKNGRHYAIYDLSAYVLNSGYFVMVPLDLFSELPENNASLGYKELNPDKTYSLVASADSAKFKEFYETYGYEVTIEDNVLTISDTKVADIPESYFTECDMVKPENITFKITFDGGVRYSV